MKTLAYDCGNPVQYVCGRMPAVLFLFTGSPRFARDESEYVKTSNAKFEQLRGYPQASAEGIRVYEVKRSADRINTRIRTGRNAPERHTHESRVNHPVDLSPTKIAFSRGPMRRHPSVEGNFAPQRYVASSPLRRGGRSPGWFIPLRRPQCIHMCRWRLYRTPQPVHT